MIVREQCEGTNIFEFSVADSTAKEEQNVECDKKTIIRSTTFVLLKSVRQFNSNES